MAITTMDGLAAAMAAGQNFPMFKSSITTVAGAMYTLWKAGGNPGPGTTPTVAAVCNDLTVGALVLPDPGANTLYLLRAALVSSNPHYWCIYDRLANRGDIAPTVLTAQALALDIVTPASQGRCDADGTDVEWFFEIYTVMGAGTPTITVTYTNHLGVSGRTLTVAMATTLPVSRLVQIIPNTNATDKIKSIESLTLSATMTSGVFGITARKRITTVPQASANIGLPSDALALGIPVISKDACLEICVLAAATSSGSFLGDIKVGAG